MEVDGQVDGKGGGTEFIKRVRDRASGCGRPGEETR